MKMNHRLSYLEMAMMVATGRSPVKANSYRDEVDRMTNEEIIAEKAKIDEKKSGLTKSQRDRVCYHYLLLQQSPMPKGK